MSTFIWGKIKFKEMPKKLEDYQREDILIYFYNQREDSLYLSDLCESEIYFNIACGYEEMIPRDKKCPYLNCDTSFFNLGIPKNQKRIESFEPFYTALKKRLKRLQDFIVEIYNNPNMENITYFHTETGNEISLDEYKVVDWKIEEFAERFFDAIEECRGLTPTIQATFAKNK